MLPITTAFAVIAAASLAMPLVNAHGYVQHVDLDGTGYDAWLPFTDPYNSPVPQRISRKVQNDSPVLDIHSNTLACNVQGEDPAPLIGDIQAGKTLSFKWNTWPADHIGPITVYLAPCPTDDCSTLSSSSARWFPIDKRGLDTTGQWFTPQFIAAGATLTTTIPPTLKPGAYLARMEIIGLHSTGAPQFYPSCTQIRVSGSGSDIPSDSEMVSIPGLYDGHVFPDVWSNPTQYTMAGPAVPAFAASVNPSGPSSGGGGAAPAPPSPPAASSPPNGGNDTPSSSVAAPPPTSTDGAGNTAPGAPIGSNPGGHQSVCKLRRRKNASLKKRQGSLLDAVPIAHRRLAGRRRSSF
jgi:hypothetical protein